MSSGFHRMGGNVPGKLKGFSNIGHVLSGQMAMVATADLKLKPDGSIGPSITHTFEPGPPKMTKDQARQSGYTGDQCSHCGSMQLRNNGTCKVCDACGTTTGCS